MTRSFALPLPAFIAALALTVVAERAAAITIETETPVACSADVEVTVVRISPLIIDASVHQRCNTTHDLIVTYQPENLTNPQHLQITLEGQQPSVRAPGSASFTDLPFTDSIQHVRITYNGPRTEREQLAQTVRIGVSY